MDRDDIKVIHADGSYSIGKQNKQGEWHGDVDEFFPDGSFKLRYRFHHGELMFIY